MTAIRKTKKQTSSLRVEKVKQRTALGKLIDTTWTVAHAALWSKQEFTKKEAIAFKGLIADHFEGVKSVDKTFMDLCERMCLAKRYVARKRGRYISKPIDWLNKNYKNGIAGTESWLEEVKQQRLTVPKYNKGINTLAKAVLSYTKTHSAPEFHKYCKKLTQQKQFDLLQVFYNTVINITL